MRSVQIIDVYPDCAFYRQGELVRLTIRLANTSRRPEKIRLIARVTFLACIVAYIERTISLEMGEKTIKLDWQPLYDYPRGYGIDLQIVGLEGFIFDTASTAFDILECWTQAPRYGFLSDFTAERADTDETMAWLARYHINRLQLYDGMDWHADLLGGQEPCCDSLGRAMSRHSIETLIEAAHRRNIAVMPSSAIDGAAPDFDDMCSDDLSCAAGRDSDSSGTIFPHHSTITMPETTAAPIRPAVVLALSTVNSWPSETVAQMNPDFVLSSLGHPVRGTGTCIPSSSTLSGSLAANRSFLPPIRTRRKSAMCSWQVL